MAKKDKTGGHKETETWQERVDKSNRAYEIWEEEYKCKKLEDYYLGHQHEVESSDEYTINLFFPTLEIRLPRLLFNRPKVRIKPRPTKADDPMSSYDERISLLENTSDTLVSSKTVGYSDANMMALRDSFSRFGVVMYGYSADSADNPNAGKPALTHDNKEMRDKTGNMVVQGQRIMLSEMVYARWIPAKQFRVPATSKNKLEDNAWCGFWDWMYPEDIKANKHWGNTDDPKVSGKLNANIQTNSEPEDETKAGMVKVWFIWDIRTSKRYVWADGGDKFFLDGEEYTDLPFSIYVFHPILGQFYPKPPMYDWKSPQDELNETRNAHRVHRRRFKRRFTVIKGRIAPEELSKLESNEDGAYAFVTGHDAVQPVEDAPLDRSVYANAPATKEDFMMISNVGGEQRGVSESDTATQANIIEQNLNIREGAARKIVATALSNGVYIMLQTMRHSYALPFLIETGVDKASPGAPVEAMRIATTWKQITADELGDFDFDVEIDVEQLSPVNEEQQRQSWGQILGLFSNPTLMMVLASSDTMLRKTLQFHGIRGDQDVSEIKQSMIRVLSMIQAQSQAAAAAKGPGGAGPKPPAGAATPGPTPTNAGTRQQLRRQMPM